MTALTLHYHPLSSFCHKALIALYETGAPFDPLLVNLGDAESRSAFLKVWPLGKFPVLEDKDRRAIIPESTTIIDYLDQHYPGPIPLVPRDADLARETRARDRFLDLYIHMPMQRIVADRLRPTAEKDPASVAKERAGMSIAYDILETWLGEDGWLMGRDFTLADCAAAPALDYAERVHPYSATHPRMTAYYRRLSERPSYARVLKVAEPYRHMFPG